MTSWLRHVRRAAPRTRGLDAMLALVVLVATAVLGILPQEARRAETDSLRSAVRSASTSGRSVTVSRGQALTGAGLTLAQRPGAAGDIGAVLSGGSFRPPVADTRLEPLPTAPTGLQAPLEIGVLIPDEVGEAVRWVAGRAPVASPSAPSARMPAPLQVGVSQLVAEAVGARVGTRWVVPVAEGHPPVQLVVSGVFAPRRPQDDLWDELAPTLSVSDRDSPLKVFVLAATGDHDRYLSRGALAATASYRWTWTLDPAVVTAADAPGLEADVATALERSHDLFTARSATSQIASTVATWRQAVTVARAVDGILTTGLLVLTGALLVMLAALRAQVRAPDHALLVSRGASWRQLMTFSALGTLPWAVGGAALGEVVVLAVDRGAGDPGLAAALGAAAVAVSAAWAAPAARTLSAPRGAVAARALTAARALPALVLLATTVLAVAAAHGSSTSGAGASDPLVALAPALVALSAAVLLLGVLTAATRRCAHLAGRRSDAASWLGLVTSVRTSAAARLPLVALTVAGALAVLAAGMGRTATAQSELGGWRVVGADVRVSGEVVGQRELQVIRRVPGVRQVCAVHSETSEVVAGQGDFIRTPVRVRTAPVAELVALRRGSPVALTHALPGASTRGVGAIVSRPVDAAGVVVSGTRVALGDVVVDPALDDGGELPVVLLDDDDLRRAGVPPAQRTDVLIGGDEAARRTLVDGSGPLATTALVAVARDDAATQGIGRSLADHLDGVLRLVLVATMVLAALAGYVLPATTAESRRALLARARVLGMTERDRRLTVLVQLLPGTQAALLVGVLTGAVVPVALPRLVDLGVFGGGQAYPRIEPGALVVLGTWSGLALVVLAVAVRDLGRVARVGLSTVLRRGDA